MRLVAGLVIALAFLNGAARAQNDRTELDGLAPPTVPSGPTEGQKRRMLLPFIRAATDCISRNSLTDPRVIDAYRSLSLRPVVATAWNACKTQLERIVTEHDRLHGVGTGLPFVNGPYSDDVTRAVTARIKPDIDARIAAATQAETRRLAEIARLEEQRRLEEVRAQALRVEEIARSERIADIARDVAYNCTTINLLRTVVAAEPATTLVETAMFSCQTTIDSALDTRVETFRVKFPGVSNPDLRSFRGEVLDVMRRQILTHAVRMKAEMNSPAPSISAPERPAVPPVAVASTSTRPVTAPATVSSPKPSIEPLRECLTAVSNARNEKLVDQAELLKMMIELCRTEIEGLARGRYLADTGKPLVKHRETAAVEAHEAAVALLSQPTP